jgi:hypothetical protein
MIESENYYIARIKKLTLSCMLPKTPDTFLPSILIDPSAHPLIEILVIFMNKRRNKASKNGCEITLQLYFPCPSLFGRAQKGVQHHFSGTKLGTTKFCFAGILDLRAAPCQGVDFPFAARTLR